MEDEEIMDIEAVINEQAPLLWTRKLTLRLLSEFKRLAPKVGITIKNMNTLHAVLSKMLKNEFKCDVTPQQVGNKLKSIKRKYHLYKEKGGNVAAEFGPGLEEIIKIMDRTAKTKARRFLQDIADESAVRSIKQANDEAYSVEIVEDSLQAQGEIMDISQFLQQKCAETSKGATSSNSRDPLEGDVLFMDEKSRKSEVDKFNLLEKKIETQEKTLEERLRKNELIEERNRLIATLLTKKTKSDVIDAIRKDRLLHHREMRDLWVERLELEKKKLHEKKRKNDLLEERNRLMKALLKQTNMRIELPKNDSHDEENFSADNDAIVLE